jgi:hypothetical protein
VRQIGTDQEKLGTWRDPVCLHSSRSDENCGFMSPLLCPLGYCPWAGPKSQTGKGIGFQQGYAEPETASQIRRRSTPRS